MRILRSGEIHEIVDVFRGALAGQGLDEVGADPGPGLFRPQRLQAGNGSLILMVSEPVGGNPDAVG